MPARRCSWTSHPSHHSHPKWWLAVSGRGKTQLPNEPCGWGDASPDAPPDASLHSTIHTFRRCLAVWCCFVAATGSPFSGSSPLLAARPGGTAVARYVTHSAGHTACHHSNLMVPPQLEYWPNQQGSPHCPRCTPHRVCRRSARAASVCGPLPSAVHHTHAVLRSPSRALLTPVSLHFAQLRTGLCGHSERQWKEMLVVVAGMSGQMGK